MKGDRSPASMWYPFWQAGLPPRSDIWSMGRALTTASAVSLSYEMDQSSVAFRGSQVGLHCIGQVLNWITEIGNNCKCFRKTNTIKPLRSALWKAFCLGHLVQLLRPWWYIDGGGGEFWEGELREWQVRLKWPYGKQTHRPMDQNTQSRYKHTPVQLLNFEK